jgi:DnaJ-class molecular chaperone
MYDDGLNGQQPYTGNIVCPDCKGSGRDEYALEFHGSPGLHLCVTCSGRGQVKDRRKGERRCSEPRAPTTE